MSKRLAPGDRIYDENGKETTVFAITAENYGPYRAIAQTVNDEGELWEEYKGRREIFRVGECEPVRWPKKKNLPLVGKISPPDKK